VPKIGPLEQSSASEQAAAVNRAPLLKGGSTVQQDPRQTYGITVVEAVDRDVVILDKLCEALSKNQTIKERFPEITKNENKQLLRTMVKALAIALKKQDSGIDLKDTRSTNINKITELLIAGSNHLLFSAAQELADEKGVPLEQIATPTPGKEIKSRLIEKIKQETFQAEVEEIMTKAETEGALEFFAGARDLLKRIDDPNTKEISEKSLIAVGKLLVKINNAQTTEERQKLLVLLGKEIEKLTNSLHTILDSLELGTERGNTLNFLTEYFKVLGGFAEQFPELWSSVKSFAYELNKSITPEDLPFLSAESKDILDKIIRPLALAYELENNPDLQGFIKLTDFSSNTPLASHNDAQKLDYISRLIGDTYYLAKKIAEERAAQDAQDAKLLENKIQELKNLGISGSLLQSIGYSLSDAKAMDPAVLKKLIAQLG
jgi:hypothetical protein